VAEEKKEVEEVKEVKEGGTPGVFCKECGNA
jgi:hypothetical protein